MKVGREAAVAVVLLVLMICFGAGELSAHFRMSGMARKYAKTGAETATFQAGAICLGCAIKKGQGAKTQYSFLQGGIGCV